MPELIAFVIRHWGVALGFCGILTSLASLWVNIQNARNAKAQRDRAVQDLRDRERRIVIPTIEEIERFASPFQRPPGSRSFPLILAFLFAGVTGFTFYQAARLEYLDDTLPRLQSAADGYRAEVESVKAQLESLNIEREKLEKKYDELQAAYAAAKRPERDLAEENLRLKQRLQAITERLNSLRALLDEQK